MNNKNKFLSIAFITLAIISLIFSIVCFTMDAGTMIGGTESSSKYGADFYTDVQNAAAQAATNTYYIGVCIVTFAECMLSIFGLAFMLVSFTFVVLGINKISESKKSEISNNKSSIPSEEEIPDL